MQRTKEAKPNYPCPIEGWFYRNWGPPSNQIMGMVLCEKAALFFKENFREAPWN